MNGAHDLGGQHGLGPVDTRPDAAKFHAPWEADAFALTLAASLHGRWNIDMARFVRENRPSADYLALPYYGLWLSGLEILAERAGMLDQRADSFPPAPPPEAMRQKFAAGFPVSRDGPAPAFAAGDRVRVRPAAPAGHTRVPRYCRGALGEILARRGCHVFPDSNAHGQGEAPKPLYTVRFAAAALFGQAAEPNAAVMIDLWEPYLEAA